MNLDNFPQFISNEVSYSNYDNEIGNSGMDDEMSIIFGNLFDNGIKIVDRNTIVFLSIKKWVEVKNVGLIKTFLAEPALLEVHRSLIKSALIITESIIEVKKERKLLNDFLKTTSKVK